MASTSTSATTSAVSAPATGAAAASTSTSTPATTTPAAASSAPTSSSSTSVKQTWKLAAEEELRLEVAAGASATIKVTEGSAEVFGAELVSRKEYTYAAGSNVPVFTWYGATVELVSPSDSLASSYTTSDTPMQVYANVHQRLEARREEATKAGKSGPRVMIVGPTDSGKSSLSRILLSYAVRVGRTPLALDLDVGQGEVSVPGTIAATALTEKCLDPQAGFVLTTPLVYFYGNTTPSANFDLYKLHVECLAAALNKRMADPAARASGCVINTCGWVTGAGYKLILHAARTLAVDVVLVMGVDKLVAEFSKDHKTARVPAIVSAPPASGAAAAAAGGAGGGAGAGAAASTDAPASTAAPPQEEVKPVDVVKLPRSGGAVTRSSAQRRSARQDRIRQYFYGVDGALSPSTSTFSWDDVEVFRIGGAKLADKMMLPVGKESALDPVSATPVAITNALQYSVLAVSLAMTPQGINCANVAGFVHITAVDEDRRTITVLAPSPGPLPTKYLVQGDLSWVQ